MKHFFLIARHEYIKYVTRRGFIISLLLFPLWVMLGAIVPQLAERSQPQRVFMVVDHQGGIAEEIEAQLTRLNAAITLRALANFARTNEVDLDALAQKDPEVASMLSAPERAGSLAAYLARGGVDPVFAVLSPFLKPGWKDFTPPRSDFASVPASDELKETKDFASTVALYFNGDRGVGRGKKLAAVLLIPRSFGAADGAPAQYWTDGPPGGELNAYLRTTLTRALQLKIAQNLPVDSSEAIETLNTLADVEEKQPPKPEGTGRMDEFAQKLLPFGFAFLLFLSTFISANALLMGVIEEKSTRMIEILLSCASPREIMAGKLLGALGASLTTITLWALGLFAAVSALSPEIAGALAGGAVNLLSTGNAPLVVFYFACGLLIYGALFLGIGSMAASVTDAQALLGPATLIIILPNIFISVILSDPNGLLARIVSWIPLYTPYFMLMRLPSEPPAIEIWATAGLTLLTTVFIVLQMSNVFANNVLTTERPPEFGAFLRRLVKRGARRSG